MLNAKEIQNIGNNEFECTSACQFKLAQNYFDLLNAIGKANSTIENVDALISAMHDEVKYVHVRFGAEFDKPQWRKAFIRNLKKGFYNSTDKQESRILNVIQGKGFMAVEYARGEINSLGQWEREEQRLALFGFTDGKVSLVKELW